MLVVSHTYISRVGREKWRALKREFGVDVKLVVPTVWKDALFTIRYDEQKDEELDMIPVPVFFSGKEAAHAYRSLTMKLGAFKPDILHVEEGSDAVSYAQALCARRLLAPRARSVFFTWMNFEKRLKFPFTLVERFNLAASDAAICGNRDAGDILRRKGFSRPIHVLPLLGMDPDLFRPHADAHFRASLNLASPVIGFIGRFVEEKGILDLLEAAARIPMEFSLLLVGGGVLEPRIKARAAELGLDRRLRIVPPVPHDKVPRYINAMDILVLPSFTVPHWREQFGQVLVQAMACEVPVIGSMHAEIPRVIGDAGLIFPERDIDELASRLTELIGSGKLRAEYGVKGRARVLENFTHSKIAEKTLEIYRNLLKA